MFNKMENNLHPASFIRYFRAGPIVVEIEYVDYILARNILSTLDSWINEVELSKKSLGLLIAQRYSHWIPRFSSALMLIVSSTASFNLVDKMLIDNQSNTLLAKFLILTLSFVSVSIYIGTWLGKLIESSIDNIHELSYIFMNRGDEKLIANFNKKIKTGYIHTTLYSLIITIHAIACGLISSYIYEKLFQ